MMEKAIKAGEWRVEAAGESKASPIPCLDCINSVSKIYALQNERYVMG